MKLSPKDTHLFPGNNRWFPCSRCITLSEEVRIKPGPRRETRWWAMCSRSIEAHHFLFSFLFFFFFVFFFLFCTDCVLFQFRAPRLHIRPAVVVRKRTSHRALTGFPAVKLYWRKKKNKTRACVLIRFRMRVHACAKVNSPARWLPLFPIPLPSREGFDLSAARSKALSGY